MFEVKVTISLDKNAEKVLQNLIKGLSGGQTVIAKSPTLVGGVVAKEVNKAKSKAEEKPAEGKGDSQELTINTIKDKAKQKIKEGKRGQVVSTLSDFGLKNISSAEPDQFEDLYKALGAL